MSESEPGDVLGTWESVGREPAEQGCVSRKVAWSHQYLQDSIVLSLFKVQRKEKCRRPKGAGSRAVLWSWAVLHSQRVIPSCMLWFMQVSRWFWVIPKDKFYIAHTSSNTSGSIPCNRKELGSFFWPRNELLNSRPWASACGACKITYTKKGQFLVYKVIKIQS